MPRGLGLLAGLCFVAGCSALVDPDDTPLLCTLTAGRPDPCPVGLWCVDGECTSTPGVDAGCMPSDETCDGRDNDCDGMIDEGHDLDMDGFTWCGDGLTMDNPLVDCNNTDPTVHPADPAREILAAIEVCDGQDNDCNGVVDDPGPGLCQTATDVCSGGRCVDPRDCTVSGQDCAMDQRCELATMPPMCVAGGCLSTPCTGMGEECDEMTRSCVVRKPMGESCGTHAECMSRNCVPSSAVGLSGQGFCSSACCRDSDCNAGTICWASGRGAKVCVPESMLGRTRGAGGAGTGCGAGSECASGICVSEVCLANCARDSECPGVCTWFGPYNRTDADAMIQTACVSPVGPLGRGEFCANGGWCRTGICINNECSSACGTSTDCGPWYCDAVAVREYGSSDPYRYMHLCVPDPGGGGTTGVDCTTHEACRDRLCLNGSCADTCCSDATCVAGTHCRPILLGDHWEMRCER